MHGLINRAIQCFIIDTYGAGCWSQVAQSVGLAPEGFEAMLSYEHRLTQSMLEEVSQVLAKPSDMVLEDVGTYLVSHPNTESVRRLLRFGGETFTDFLHSLDDLPDRARLAVADLEVPELELKDEGGGRFELRVTGPPGFAHTLTGTLRALADDYGALAFLERHQETGNRTTIAISVVDSAFAEGRSFSLAQPSAPKPGEAAR